MSDLNLRKKLQSITETFIGNRASEQIHLIENLKNQGLQHSITLHREAICGKPETFQFNCYMFACDLIGSSEVEGIARRHAEIFPSSKYILFLKDSKVLEEIEILNTASGIIVYYEDNVPRHAGKFSKGRICSKWGLCHTWEHNIFETPLSYGNEVRLYKSINRNEAISGFFLFAKSNGA